MLFVEVVIGEEGGVNVRVLISVDVGHIQNTTLLRHHYR